MTSDRALPSPRPSREREGSVLVSCSSRCLDSPSRERERAGGRESSRSSRSFLLALSLVVSSWGVAAAQSAENLSRDDVLGVVRRHQREIRMCYERELLDRPRFAFRVVVRWRIDRRGAVTSARVDGIPSPRVPRLEQCILRAIRTWAFPARGDAEVRFPFVFSAEP
jgi:TonB family protein